MDNFIEMTEDEWFETYKPIKNHIDTNASFDGHMFETYGDEVEFVKSQPENRIWMYGDGDDGGTYIWSGWGFVNRIGYLVSQIPVPENTKIQIKMSPYWYCCEGCGTEMEDDGQLINERYSEFDKCPECCTLEELIELEKE